jgi:hypothetical protein
LPAPQRQGIGDGDELNGSETPTKTIFQAGFFRIFAIAAKITIPPVS